MLMFTSEPTSDGVVYVAVLSRCGHRNLVWSAVPHAPTAPDVRVAPNECRGQSGGKPTVTSQDRRRREMTADELDNTSPRSPRSGGLRPPWVALRDQNVDLPQLRDDLFRLVSLPCHYSPP
jgi:hypothetical protein